MSVLVRNAQILSSFWGSVHLVMEQQLHKRFLKTQKTWNRMMRGRNPHFPVPEEVKADFYRCVEECLAFQDYGLAFMNLRDFAYTISRIKEEGGNHCDQVCAVVEAQMQNILDFPAVSYSSLRLYGLTDDAVAYLVGVKSAEMRNRKGDKSARQTDDTSLHGVTPAQSHKFDVLMESISELEHQDIYGARLLVMDEKGMAGFHEVVRRAGRILYQQQKQASHEIPESALLAKDVTVHNTWLEASPDNAVNPEWALQQREAHMRIAEFARALPEQQRQTILLFQHGLTYAEIARVLGKSEGTIKATIFQIRDKAKKQGLEDDLV